MPLITQYPSTRGLRCISSSLCPSSVGITKISAVIVMRYRTSTNDGAVENRIKIAAKEMPTVPDKTISFLNVV